MGFANRRIAAVRLLILTKFFISNIPDTRKELKANGTVFAHSRSNRFAWGGIWHTWKGRSRHMLTDIRNKKVDGCFI